MGVLLTDINSTLILENEVSENGEQRRIIHDTGMPHVSYRLAVSSYYPWSAIITTLAKWVP